MVLTFRAERAPSLWRGEPTKPSRGFFMRLMKWIATGMIVLVGIVAAKAETYPSRPVTIIVPFPAGGPTDTIARIMADHMKNTLGQAVLVETVTGAGATI